MSSLFGKWVTVNQRLGRRSKVPSRLDRERGLFEGKTWEPFKISPRRVLVIGRRTLQNGETWFADGGDAIVWRKSGSGVPAYLVVENDFVRFTSLGTLSSRSSIMLTLKERLEHGDLDSFLNRDEVKELLELYDLAQDPDYDVIEDAREEGREKGFEDGKAEGEEIEFDRLQSDYKEAKAEAIGDVIVPEWGILRELITKLDELFEVE